MITIEKINNLNKSDFLGIFGNVFEKSDWIAEKVFDLKPFKNNEDIFLKIIGIYENSDKNIILRILNSHPELVVEKKLTSNSKNEPFVVDASKKSILLSNVGVKPTSSPSSCGLSSRAETEISNLP